MLDFFLCSGKFFLQIIMVHAEGLEPPTLGSEDRCSIQLSYACMSQIIRYSNLLAHSLQL